MQYVRNWKRILVLLFVIWFNTPADIYGGGIVIPWAFPSPPPQYTAINKLPVSPAYITITPGYKQVILIWGMPVDVEQYKTEYYRHINKNIRHTDDNSKYRQISHSSPDKKNNSHYNIYVAVDQNGGYNKIGFTTTTSYTITGLTNGTVYCFAVTVGKGAGESARLTQACSAPQGIFIPVDKSLGGIAIDKDNKLWMTNYYNNGISKSDSDGIIQGLYIAGKKSEALALDTAGNVWVVNRDDGIITKLTSTGITIGTYHISSHIKDIAIDVHNNAWVMSDNNVIKLNPEGEIVGSFIAGINPGGIAIDSSGHLWTTLSHEKAIAEMRPTGTIANIFKLTINPLDIAIGPSDTLWVGSSRSRKIAQLKQSQIITEQGSSPVISYHDTYRGYYPSSMAIDALGNVWLVNKGSRQIIELNKDGDLSGAYNMPPGLEPGRIAIDDAGDVFVAHPRENNFTEIVGAAKAPQYSLDKLQQNTNPIITHTYHVGDVPRGIAIDASENIWVTNWRGNSVNKLNPDGIIIGTYSVLNMPLSIAIDAFGNAWVTNWFFMRVTELSINGEVIKTYPVGKGAQGIAVDASNNIWVTNTGNNSVAGGWENTVTKLYMDRDRLGVYNVGTHPDAVAIDASGNVWVANGGSHNVTKLSSRGTILGTYPVGRHPSSIAIDASNRVWVVNNQSNNVTELNSAGKTIGAYAVGKSPAGIAIDNSGNVWITNSLSNTLTELNASGKIIATYPVGKGPEGIAIDAHGNVWVTNAGCNGDNTWNGNSVTELIGVASGPQYWPYKGPQWP